MFSAPALALPSGSYQIAQCNSDDSERPAYSFAVSVDVTALKNSEEHLANAQKIQFKGIVDGKAFSQKLNLKRTGYNMSVEPTPDDYASHNWFNFVVKERNEEVIDAAELDFIWGNSYGYLYLNLDKNSPLEAVSGHSLPCKLYNTEAVLMKLNIGPW
jgi:hypothetical protein